MINQVEVNILIELIDDAINGHQWDERIEELTKIKRKLKILSVRNEKKYLTTHEAAKILWVTPTTVISWTKEGKIKSKRTSGGHRRYSIEEIERFQVSLENTEEIS